MSDAAAAPAQPSLNPQVALANFQTVAVGAIRDSVVAAANYQHHNPSLRQEVARRVGATLLQAPTGSGKTLMLGRALEAIRGKTGAPCVWFWFAPYSGLVAQTRAALAEQCPSLRLRELGRDRSAPLTRDGDVFVQTWALVATNRKEARKVRSRTEAAPALDDMLEDLRDRGVRIGVVIDEAHLNFGTSAQAAAAFYLNVLRPDFTLLATATPNDDRLEDFERQAGVAVENRILVSREQVVTAGLNKLGLQLGVVRIADADLRTLDPEQATLAVAWRRHGQIKARLAERGLAVTPLMLVQVEDQAAGGRDPLERVRDKLLANSVPASAIRSHTSGEPDPDFHTLAYDPACEVLIFKVAVATGFDAPRAWTLVSVRPSRGTTFGLQVVGRIMRVHPLVRPLHGSDPLLDRGYVFLSDPELQAGLDAAAAELKAVRSSVESIADELQVLEFTDAPHPRLGERRVGLPEPPPPPRDDAERQGRLGALIASGEVDASLRDAAPVEQDQAIVRGEWRRSVDALPLFGDALPLASAPGAPIGPRAGLRALPLRTDRGVPPALLSEQLPPLELLDAQVVQDAARMLFGQARTPFDYLMVTLGRASVSLRDLFLEERGEEFINVRMSDAQIAEQAQASFEFNAAVNPRTLKQAIVAQFARVAESRGTEITDPQPLRRALELFALNHPDAIPTALREAQAAYLRIAPADPIPPLWVGEGEALTSAERGAYDVFPPNMNNEERAFAELLDRDASGRVKWWLRLQENASWAPTLLLPTGRRFFPDFAVGVLGRGTPDSIALVETKDDGVTGRLHSEANRDKIRAQHREYRRVTWTYRRSDGRWIEAGYDNALEQIVPLRPFTTDALIRVV